MGCFHASLPRTAAAGSTPSIAAVAVHNIAAFFLGTFVAAALRRAQLAPAFAKGCRGGAAIPVALFVVQTDCLLVPCSSSQSSFAELYYQNTFYLIVLVALSLYFAVVLVLHHLGNYPGVEISLVVVSSPMVTRKD